MSAANHDLCDAVVVAGHAPFKATIDEVPARPEQDDAWVLQSFQAGEPPLYLEHIRRGVELAIANPAALLIFSGGYTRAEAGVRWSEAATYAALAARTSGWNESLADRTALEDFSRDSFENLLFSLARFHEVTGRWPRHVTLVSWAFKRHRFDQHRAAIRFPAGRFTFEGSGSPVKLAAALAGEEVTLRAFSENLYGSADPIAAKRAQRNPLRREHPFRQRPGLGGFFSFINNPDNACAIWPGRLPWED